MNKSQQKAIELFKYRVEQFFSAHDVKEYGAKITRFDVRDEPCGNSRFVSVAVETELTALPNGNLLKALDHTHWLAFIGDKGAINLHSGPKSLEQFKGKKQYMGMNIHYGK